jgi:hypothetical protein
VSNRANEDVIASIEFVLDEFVNDLEYRFFVNDRVHVTINRIVLRELSAMSND